jgi:hypothetical protein
MNSVLRIHRQPIPRHHSFRAGLALIYLTVIVAVLFAFASLAVDFGRVQIARSQLQTVVDSSARYSAQAIAAGADAVLDRCNTTAADNTIVGQTISFNSGNVQLGTWDLSKRSFTPGGQPANAVKVTQTFPVPLLLGPAINIQSCDVRASAVAYYVPMGFMALNLVDFKNNTFVGGYDSTKIKTPTPGTATQDGHLYANGQIGGKNNGKVNGNIILGPNGSLITGFNWDISGTVSHVPQPIPAPAVPGWSPTGNPGGTPQAFVYNSSAPMPGGTYYFSKLVVNHDMAFLAPATFIVNGDVTVTSDVTAYNLDPNNLTIYQLGTGNKFQANGSIYAKIISPGNDFETKNNLKLYGAAVFNTITVKNNSEFYFDESASATSGQLAIVQ